MRVRMTFNADVVDYLAQNVIELINRGFRMVVPVADLFDKTWSDEKISILSALLCQLK